MQAAAHNPAAEEPRSESFAWPVRVYYEDTDAGGVVYYANYLKFTERARTEWLRAAGFEQTDLAKVHGVVFVVRAFAIDYLKPARFDDALRVTVELIKVGAGQIDLIQRVMREDEELATAAVKIACVRLETMRPVRIPREILAKLRQDSGIKKERDGV
ncbi:MAG TPA: tol-pal system-associated acyl-CoA thioesterase [Burkholderiales bacterium]|nr:tol-pal system-associated acyl-CoA thioesterase [Burkholderiales bacterium]